MRRQALVIGLAVGLAAGALGAPGQQRESRGVVVYVSPAGNDAWSGRLEAPNRARTDGPFATIARARDAVRALSADERGRGPVRVIIRGGRYELSEPLVFLPEDSGAPGRSVSYEAYPGERPVISGGRRIDGWRETGAVWAARAPAGLTFRQLFVNGRRAQRARTPDEGFFLVDGEISLDARAAFKYRGNDVDPAWTERGDVEVVALQAWAEIRMPIVAVDAASRTVTLAGRCAPSNRESNARYWIENAPDAVDAPGEWRLDGATHTIHYLPRPGEDMERAEAIAPALAQLVRIEGDPAGGRLVSCLEFRGLTFSHTDWSLPAEGYTDMQAAYDIPAAFEANGATSVTIQNCTFEHVGGYAIAFVRGCSGNAVTGTEIADVGAGGIKIGEPVIRRDERDMTGTTRVVGNHIHDIGVVYPAAVGVWVGQSAGNVIARNHIHDTYYSALSIGWTWGYGETNARDNTVEANHIHDIGRGMLSDMGGVYTLGVQPGTVIRGNVFHDITSYGYGGWGIYLDEGSTHILVEDNLVYDTKTGGFHQHYGRENVVRNNIFAFSQEGQIIRTRAEDHLSFTFEHNIVYWDRGYLLGGDWSGEGFHVDHNVYWNAGEGGVDFAGASLAEWRRRGHDAHSVVADPRFEDAGARDFRLKQGSPALEVGFDAARIPSAAEVGPGT